MTKEEMVLAFNTWMEDYCNNPEGFQKTSSSVIKFFKEKLEGREPSYGETCTALMHEYLKIAIGEE